MKKPGSARAIAALLSAFHLPLIHDVPVLTLESRNGHWGARRGRRYGGGSRKYGGPRDATRRPVITKERLAAYRRAAERQALKDRLTELNRRLASERRAKVKVRLFGRVAAVERKLASA